MVKVEKENYTKGYGKRPLWQWIIIYIIIGTAIYLLIYFLVIAKRNSTNTINYNYAPASPVATNAPTINNAPVYKAPAY